MSDQLERIDKIKSLAQASLQEKWMNPISCILDGSIGKPFCYNAERRAEEVAEPLISCDHCLCPKILCIGHRRKGQFYGEPESLSDMITLYHKFPEDTSIQTYLQNKLGRDDTLWIQLMVSALKQLTHFGKILPRTKKRIRNQIKPQ